MTTELVRLLSADEPTAVEEIHGNGASPFLLVCDHAGHRVPARIDLGIPQGELLRHIGWDIGIAGVARALSDALDAALIMQPYSRLVIDCNRPPGVPSSIPEASDGTKIPGNIALPPQHAEQRRIEIFEPYHRAIERHLDARKAAGRPTILIALHSFTPLYGGLARPWHAGVLYNRYRDLAISLRDALRQSGELKIGDMEPYTVSDDTDYTVPVHGERRSLAHVGIEIRQDLIETASGQRQWAARLADVLPRAAAKIGQFSR